MFYVNLRTCICRFYSNLYARHEGSAVSTKGTKHTLLSQNQLFRRSVIGTGTCCCLANCRRTDGGRSVILVPTFEKIFDLIIIDENFQKCKVLTISSEILGPTKVVVVVLVQLPR